MLLVKSFDRFLINTVEREDPNIFLFYPISYCFTVDGSKKVLHGANAHVQPCWFVFTVYTKTINATHISNFSGGVDSSFVPLQCFLWYSQCLLSQKSFLLDTRKRGRKNFLLAPLVMKMLWKRSQTIMNKWTKKFLPWDLERMSEVKYVFEWIIAWYIRLVLLKVQSSMCCILGPTKYWNCKKVLRKGLRNFAVFYFSWI